MNNLTFKVTSYGSSRNHYVIMYRRKFTGFWSFLNFLIPWNTLYRTFHMGTLASYPDKFHPVLYENFDEAVRDAKKYKDNPKLMEDFIKSEREKYDRIYNECYAYDNKRRKSKVIE